MKREVRPSRPEEAAAIVALLQAADLRADTDPEHLYWKYWQTRADWTGPRSFVLANGRSLSAHCAIIPGSCAAGTGRVTTVQMIDWAARPGDVGAGVTLMKYVARQSGALLSIGGSAHTLQILPHMGFRDAGMVTGYARPLFPARMLRVAGDRTWKLPARFARALAWKLAAPSAAGTDWRSRRIGKEEVDCVAAVLPQPRGSLPVLERTIDLLRYALSCPIVSMHLYAIERGGRLRGYFLLAVARHQVRIVDCWVDSDEFADWSAMIDCAVTEARRDPGGVEIVAWANDPLLERTLQARGFHARTSFRLQLRSTSGAPILSAHLRVQMLDSDDAYRHADTLWT